MRTEFPEDFVEQFQRRTGMGRLVICKSGVRRHEENLRLRLKNHLRKSQQVCQVRGCQE